MVEPLSGEDAVPLKTGENGSRRESSIVGRIENFRQTSESLDDVQRQDLFKGIKVVIARGIHLFPFRTEKLSLTTPMVLRKWESR